MITFESTGSFKNTESFLQKITTQDLFQVLDRYAREGVSALALATPVDSGETAAAWGYKINRTRGSVSIIWTNNHTHDGVPVAIILQYGHGTGTGGYVQGRDYINPAIKPIFDKIANDVWRVVTSA